MDHPREVASLRRRITSELCRVFSREFCKHSPLHHKMRKKWQVSLRNTCRHSIGRVCKVSPSGSVFSFLGGMAAMENTISEITWLAKCHAGMRDLGFPASVIVVVFFLHHTNGTSFV